MNSIPSLAEILEMIKAMKSFDVNDYIITTEDGKHKLKIQDIIKAESGAGIRMYIIDDEKQFIHFEFSNGQSISLNKQSDSWIVEDRRSKGVYLISSGEHTKIGIADNPLKRLRSLQTGSPMKLELIGFWECKNPLIVEKDLHRIYENKHVNGEWFNLTKRDIADIRKYLEDVDGQAT